MATVKPILIFYVQTSPLMLKQEVQDAMEELTAYVEYQRKDVNDFDFFVIPRQQQLIYEVEILNPVTVTEQSYKTLKLYAQNLLNKAIQELNKRQ